MLIVGKKFLEQDLLIQDGEQIEEFYGGQLSSDYGPPLDF